MSKGKKNDLKRIERGEIKGIMVRNQAKKGRNKI